MGVNTPILMRFYKQQMQIIPPVALLGFIDNHNFEGDLYDLQIGNWNINSEWKLNKKYNTIICTRCAYFSKNPEDFIERCYNNLNDGGKLYVDWGIGDHWRYNNFKVGWVKDGEHERQYGIDNYLWSMVWDDGFLQNDQCIFFSEEVKKYGYSDLKKAIFDEVPKVIDLNFIKQYFDVNYDILLIKSPYLQMYVLIKGTKRGY